MENKEIIENYQCAGCSVGFDTSCYEKGYSLCCCKHSAGTFVLGVGSILLGTPKGFNRVNDDIDLGIYDEFQEYDKFNIPCWKHLDDLGNTIVRGLSPRVNRAFIDIFIGNHLDKIDCLEITDKDISEMD